MFVESITYATQNPLTVVGFTIAPAAVIKLGKVVSNLVKFYWLKQEIKEDLKIWCDKKKDRAEYEHRQTASERILQAYQNSSRDLKLNLLHLSSLPKCIVKLPHVKYLDISNNNLRRLPGFIKDLNLRVLHAQANWLTTIPNLGGEASSLYQLDISLNRLSNLPRTVTELSKLVELNISENEPLIGLPRHIKNLRELKKLDISENGLDTLPKNLIKLSKLERLDLSQNHFTHIPKFLVKMPSICTINMHWNHIYPISLQNFSNAQRAQRIGNRHFGPSLSASRQNLMQIVRPTFPEVHPSKPVPGA